MVPTDPPVIDIAAFTVPIQVYVMTTSGTVFNGHHGILSKKARGLAKLG